MDPILSQLKSECDAAARNFLSIEAWASPKWRIRAAVDDLIACGERSSLAMSRLLREAEKVPTQFEPNRRLYELVQAIKALENRKRALGEASSPAAKERTADRADSHVTAA